MSMMSRRTSSAKNSDAANLAPVLRTCTPRLGLGLFGILFGDEAVLDHAVDHPVAALDRPLWKAERVVVARRLGKRGEIGAISDGEFVERFVPIGLRRCGHAIGT